VWAEALEAAMGAARWRGRGSGGGSRAGSGGGSRAGSGTGPGSPTREPPRAPSWLRALRRAPSETVEALQRRTAERLAEAAVAAGGDVALTVARAFNELWDLHDRLEELERRGDFASACLVVGACGGQIIASVGHFVHDRGLSPGSLLRLLDFVVAHDATVRLGGRAAGPTSPGSGSGSGWELDASEPSAPVVTTLVGDVGPLARRYAASVAEELLAVAEGARPDVGAYPPRIDTTADGSDDDDTASGSGLAVTGAPEALFDLCSTHAVMVRSIALPALQTGVGAACAEGVATYAAAVQRDLKAIAEAASEACREVASALGRGAPAAELARRIDACGSLGARPCQRAAACVNDLHRCLEALDDLASARNAAVFRGGDEDLLEAAASALLSARRHAERTLPLAHLGALLSAARSQLAALFRDEHGLTAAAQSPRAPTAVGEALAAHLRQAALAVGGRAPLELTMETVRTLFAAVARCLLLALVAAWRGEGRGLGGWLAAAGVTAGFRLPPRAIGRLAADVRALRTALGDCVHLVHVADNGGEGAGDAREKRAAVGRARREWADVPELACLDEAVSLLRAGRGAGPGGGANEEEIDLTVRDAMTARLRRRSGSTPHAFQFVAMAMALRSGPGGDLPREGERAVLRRAATLVDASHLQTDFERPAKELAGSGDAWDGSRHGRRRDFLIELFPDATGYKPLHQLVAAARDGGVQLG
jgi:hypothetical protein